MLTSKHREEGRGSRFIPLLIAMCSLNGRPVARCQAKVHDHFLVGNLDIVPCVRYRRPGKPELQMGSGDTWVPVDDPEFTGVLPSDIWKCSPKQKQFKMLLESLRLMTDLCKGRNRASTDFLLDHADSFGLVYHDMMASISNEALPDVFRARVTNLVRVLYIDREPLENHLPLEMHRIWAEANICDPVSRWTKANPWAQWPHLQPSEGFQDLKNFMAKYFQENSVMDSENPYQNDLIMELLKTAHAMLRFGLYFNADGTRDLNLVSRQLLEALVGVLDSDGESIFVYEGRTASIISAKMEILDILTCATCIMPSI